MKKVKWGLIGCGDISRKRVAPALRDLANCDFVAVNRAQYDLAESFAKEFGARKWYRDWRELIHDDDIDAVYVATPVNLHAEQTIAASEAGKHVLCEKPMAMNVSECDKMIQACKAKGTKLGIAYYRHFYPAIDRAKEIIAAGEIGKIIVVQINAFQRFNPQPGQPRYWFVLSDQAGGGPMFDFGCHRIEVLLNICGPIVQTFGSVSNVLFNRQVDDTATALFSFQSGAQGVLTTTHAAIEPRDTVDIYGSEGSIHIPILNQGALSVVAGNETRNEKFPPHPNFHQPLIDDFTTAVISDGNPAVGGDVGREVARIEAEIYA